MVKLNAVVFVVNCIFTGNYLLALVLFGGRRIDHQKLCQGHQQGRKVSSRIVAHGVLLMLMYGFACITLTINAVGSLCCQI